MDVAPWSLLSRSTLLSPLLLALPSLLVLRWLHQARNSAGGCNEVKEGTAEVDVAKEQADCRVLVQSNVFVKEVSSLLVQWAEQQEMFLCLRLAALAEVGTGQVKSRAVGVERGRLCAIGPGVSPGVWRGQRSIRRGSLDNVCEGPPTQPVTTAPSTSLSMPLLEGMRHKWQSPARVDSYGQHAS